jgi:arylsulfatase A-like enzyme
MAKHRTIVLWLLCSFSCTLCFGQERPNILLIFTDDQRYDAIGYAGNGIIQTPSLDQLANNGVIFRNAFVNTSVCAISRANLLIGQYPSRHGIDNFHKTFSYNQLERTYPALLKKSGYYTGFIGKWGIGHSHEKTYQAVRLFDFWAGGAGQMNFWYDADSAYVNYNGHENYSDKERLTLDKFQATTEGMSKPMHLTTQIVPAKVEQFLKQRDMSKPFALSLFYKAPHGPWEGVDPRFKDQYANQDMPRDESVSLEYEANKPEFLRQDSTMLGASTGRHWIENNASRNQVLQQYYRMISGIDDSVAQILALLKTHQVADNTVILFTSDNGFLFGEHGMAGKWLMREPSIRVPAFIYHPRLSMQLRGRQLTQQIITTDFTATVLDLARIGIPQDIQGRSLWPLVTGKPLQTPWRSEWVYEHPFTESGRLPFTQGLRGERYKYTRYINTDPVYEEFFDLLEDPQETSNLINDNRHTQLINEFRNKTDRFELESSSERQKPGTGSARGLVIALALLLAIATIGFGWRQLRR